MLGWSQSVGLDSSVHRCGTTEFEQTLQRYYPLRRLQLNALNEKIRLFTAQQSQARVAGPTPLFRIPIVVHVVHANPSGQIGGNNNPNISDEQIASQIQVLNEDYRYQAGTPGAVNASGSDTGIEFFLAQTDPQGQPTNGITRHYYPQQTSFQAYSLSDALTLSQIVDWPSDRYLNIWVTTLSGNYLGYTQFPTAADTLVGLPTDADDRLDGSIIDYQYFGRQTGTATSRYYGYGRTATHEIGHWLGLIHTWGDSDCGDDYVADTPPCEGPNQTLYCTPIYSSCKGIQTRNLIEDYMDYSPDQCMSLFTPDQIQRMRAVLQLSPRRARLFQTVTPLTGTDQLTVTLSPNPVLTETTVSVQFTGTEPLTVTLLDEWGRPVRNWTYTAIASTRLNLPVSGLPAGLYVVRVSTSQQTRSSRMLVH
ncbi:M43 family zinc metalloprotease [Spirosoma aerolatum]|uniref:M43 family zinc metalloprotease n=1 Tax=Spirosoma aerolatum TaxID=1211326 RepID=UPI001FE363EF|nr:M43 family zinc metalloprotease [Spirosoma aerolatum]